MSRSGPEIQAALKALATKWQSYQGSERGEAQTFLNDLFDCYGSDRFSSGAIFEDFRTSAGFMDLHWPEICIIEMKRPGTVLSTARDQIQRYWLESANEEENRPAARFVVICSFQKFEIWEPGRFPKGPRATVALDELADRYDVLSFLAGPSVEPSFIEHNRTMTKEAAKTVADLYASLVDGAAAPHRDIQRFVMQAVWCMFAEDVGLFEGWPFEKAVDRLVADPSRNSASELGYFFRVLNQKTKANRVDELAGTAYVNGELFGEPAEVRLNAAETRLLRQAITFNWSQVDPTIFGSLMEGVLGDRRWELGAHYTHEVDIMKIVGPTIVRPWTERIEATATPQQARDLLDELCAFKVLDPACGCGNFLYVAYRELRALESLLKQRIRDLALETGNPEPAEPWPFVRLTNMQGIEIEPASSLIARVTLWMGHRQMIDFYGPAEDPLPLVTLSAIQTADALRVPWPETDCIIGNPPFQGASHMRSVLGDDYVGWLKKAFGVGIKDSCVYWFRRAVEHLKPGQRAGLVGTNSISQNLGRSASLDYVIAHGGVITDAVSSQRWPGEAKVHVSLVNWVMQPVENVGTSVLDGLPADHISADLRSHGHAWEPRKLDANGGKCFEGPSPKAKGLLLSEDLALELRARTDADYTQVVRPYLTAADITDHPAQSPSRWVIDFGLRPLEDAMRFPAALDICRDLVRPERAGNRRKAYREKWWQFAEPRTAMRKALEGLPRFVATAGHAKRAVFIWIDQAVLASNATDVFAFDDDFSMAVLQSRAHVAWAWHNASTLETRLRYTPSSVFETFPWPDRATDAQRERAADACRRMLARRSAICEEQQIGLTKVYNAMDDGAYADLKALHREVDEAVADCYGWPKSVAQDDSALVRLLLDLNRDITEGSKPYDPWRKPA